MNGLVEQVSFKRRFDVGDVVGVASGLGQVVYYRVEYWEPFFIDYTSATIPNGSKVSVKIEDLEVNDDEVAQARFLVQTDGFKVYMRHPEAVAKYTTKNAVTGFGKWFSDNFPHMTEVWWMGDQTPRLDIENNSGADGTVNIKIPGYRYILRRIEGRPTHVAGIVYVQAVPSPGRYTK